MQLFFNKNSSKFSTHFQVQVRFNRNKSFLIRFKKKKKKLPFLNTDNNKKIDLNHKRKLSYRYRNGVLQNTKNRYREKSLT